MRFRSVLAFLLVSFVSLGLVGCGSSSDGSVATGTTTAAAANNTGALTFNFVTRQSFTVDANTNTFRFEFYEAGSSTAIYTTTANFGASVTVANIPASAARVRITGFNSSGIPLYTITQAISVTVGSTTVVPGLTASVPVTLQVLRLSGESVFALDTTLTSVALEVGSTFQVYVFGDYSDGSMVLLGSQPTFAIGTGGSGIASVDANGTVTGISAGTTQLIVEIAGQTLNVPVAVLTAGGQIFTSIQVVNSTIPIPLTSGTPVQLVVSGTNSSGTFGIAPGGNFSYSVDDTTNFSVDSSGNVSVNAGVAAGTSATVTVTYTNADTTTVTTTVGVVAQ